MVAAGLLAGHGHELPDGVEAELVHRLAEFLGDELLFLGQRRAQGLGPAPPAQSARQQLPAAV